MQTKELIENQLKRVGYLPNSDKNSLIFYSQQIDEMSNIFYQDEIVKGAVFGCFKGNIGIAIATDRRMLFIGSMPIQNKKIQAEFNYHNVTTLDYYKGWLPTAKVRFSEGVVKINISGCNPVAAEKFVNDVNQILRDLNNSSQVSKFVSQPIDVAGQLEKFAKLKDQGIITEQEFQLQKAKLLSM